MSQPKLFSRTYKVDPITKVEFEEYQLEADFFALIDNMNTHCSFLGAGSFNMVYYFESEEQSWVIRIPFPIDEEEKKKQPNKAENPERTIRILSEYYDEIFAKTVKKFVYGYVDFDGATKYAEVDAIVMPYIDSVKRELTDLELKTALITFFKKTGRVNVDGCSPGNIFIGQNNQYEFVDPVFSLRTVNFKRDNNDVLEASVESVDFARVMGLSLPQKNSAYEEYWNESSHKKPESVLTIKALLLLQKLNLTHLVSRLIATDGKDVYSFLGQCYNKSIIQDALLCDFFLLNYQKFFSIISLINNFDARNQTDSEESFFRRLLILSNKSVDILNSLPELIDKIARSCLQGVIFTNEDFKYVLKYATLSKESMWGSDYVDICLNAEEWDKLKTILDVPDQEEKIEEFNAFFTQVLSTADSSCSP